MTGGWQAGIDMGGTFIDVVARNTASGETRSAKVRTRTDDRVAGIFAALAAVDLAWEDVDDLVHGTTMATNVIVEGKLAKVALVATEGFADTLEIGRQNRLHLYRLDLPPKVAPQVPAERRFEVAERIDHRGRALTPLDRTSVDAAVSAAAASGADAVAVSLMHAYANAGHEEAVAEALAARVPYVALSSRVNPEAREYERMATTVLSASLMPLVAGYLDGLEAAKPETSRLHLFHSAGGMASPEALRDLPLGLALSGPAAGVAAAGHVAAELGIGHAISFDMGGTTTDVCLITGGRAEIDNDRKIAGRPLRQAMVAVESIGAGGGSVAALDHGALTVGPESAGADPGPACYGNGGTAPTVTDANLLLGYMDANRLLGGDIRLDAAAGRTAIAPLANAMAMSEEEAALGILRVANANMTRALGRITVERGIDGRDCTLIAFGGAGPMHAVAVARAFGITAVLVPASSSVFSALGCVAAEKNYSRQQTLRMESREWDAGQVAAAHETLHAQLAAPLIAAGHRAEEMKTETVAGVRYSGQSYAVEIPAPALDDPVALGTAFRNMHERLYGFATEEPWELVALRLTVSVPRADGGAFGPGLADGRPAAGRTAACLFGPDGPVATPRLDRAALATGQRVDGPAIVEDDWSTIVLPPGAALRADDRGHLHIDAGSAP
ncbi:MAG: hydantoinase/oxoprolinase family protein [Alphaproteobacteria bacterium]|nr:hydantoinase/oxoprolinase family protein [Alphaproteobacteria bacterium]